MDSTQSKALSKLRSTLAAVGAGSKSISALEAPVKAWNKAILASGELKGYIPSLLLWVKANEAEMQRKGIDLVQLRITLTTAQVGPVELPIERIEPLPTAP